MIVERFTTFGEAAAAKSALEAAGIGADVYDEFIASYDWRMADGIGGMKIAVSPEDFDEAADILDFEAQLAPEGVEPEARAEAPALEESDAEADATLRCPECGSDAVSRIPRVLIFGFLSLAFIGAGIALGEWGLGAAGVMAMALVALATPSHRCTSCGERWTPSRTERGEAPIEPAALSELHCPHCGSTELHHIDYRRLKVWSMVSFFLLLTPAFVLVWLFLPKWECDTCHRSSYIPNRSI